VYKPAALSLPFTTTPSEEEPNKVQQLLLSSCIHLRRPFRHPAIPKPRPSKPISGQELV